MKFYMPQTILLGKFQKEFPEFKIIQEIELPQLQNVLYLVQYGNCYIAEANSEFGTLFVLKHGKSIVQIDDNMYTELLRRKWIEINIQFRVNTFEFNKCIREMEYKSV